MTFVKQELSGAPLFWVRPGMAFLQRAQGYGLQTADLENEGVRNSDDNHPPLRYAAVYSYCGSYCT